MLAARIKGTDSLRSKAARLGATEAAVSDRLGVRIVVPKTADCYAVLALLCGRYRPLEQTFDD